ncbi:MAG: glycosyltransferase [Patescibacteria group bacterium]
MKRALIHNPYWPSLGGGERYVASFIKLLLDRGWQVDLDSPEDIPPQILSRFNLDISKVTYNSQPTTSSYSLVFWVSDGSLPISLAKKTLIHLQVPFQGVNGRSFTNWIKSRFYTFVANSNFTKKIVDAEYGIDSQVVYPPVSVEDFNPSIKKSNTILYVGRFSNLTQSKGQDILISQFKKISKILPGWQLVLVGGTKVGTTQKYIEDLKNSAEDFPIELVLDPDFSTLKKHFESAKIFWSAAGFSESEQLPPAKQEHFGMSLVEAMAAGCVPVVPNLGGHPEIVDHEVNGYLYSKLSELQDYTHLLTTDNQLLTACSQAAVKKSKIFSVSRFNSDFSQYL